MASRTELMSVEYHHDTDTETYHVGEVDYGIVAGELKYYLEKYGLKGRDEILVTLTFLAHYVIDVFNDLEKPEEAGQDQDVKAG